MSTDVKREVFMIKVCRDCIHNKVCSLMDDAERFNEKILSLVVDVPYGDLSVNFSLVIDCESKIKADGLKTEVTK